ncbi:MAG: hypothetical protein ACRCUT_15050, partial [Spirochaetota bacterium]
MLINNELRFIQTSFVNEEELERVVMNNFEYLFGPSSLFISKKLIKTIDGTGTIPDGFVVDLTSKKWYIVEAELLNHSVWSHIAPQVSKQIIASQQKSSKRLLIEYIVEQYRSSDEIKEIFYDANISEIDIRRYLEEILEKDPIVGMPIDNISEDLKEWARTLKSIVKLWIIRKYVQFDNPSNIIYEFPEEFKPEIDTENCDESECGSESINTYDVTIKDLLLSKFLSVGEKIFMSYKPRNGNKREYSGIIEEDGSISVLNKKFDSPSYAALC